MWKCGTFPLVYVLAISGTFLQWPLLALCGSSWLLRTVCRRNSCADGEDLPFSAFFTHNSNISFFLCVYVLSLKGCGDSPSFRTHLAATLRSLADELEKGTYELRLSQMKRDFIMNRLPPSCQPELLTPCPSSLFFKYIYTLINVDVEYNLHTLNILRFMIYSWEDACLTGYSVFEV